MELPREVEAGVDSEFNDRSVFVHLIVASPICGSFSTRHGSDSPVRLGGRVGLARDFLEWPQNDLRAADASRLKSAVLSGRHVIVPRKSAGGSDHIICGSVFSSSPQMCVADGPEAAMHLCADAGLRKNLMGYTPPEAASPLVGMPSGVFSLNGGV